VQACNGIVVCYDKMLVNVAAYLTPGYVCVCVCVYVMRSKHYLFVRMLVYNKHLLFNMHGMNIKVILTNANGDDAAPRTRVVE
jgi:hypothetical protein